MPTASPELVSQLDPEEACALLREQLAQLPGPPAKEQARWRSEGAAVAQLLREQPELSARKVAALAGCSPSRVAEVRGHRLPPDEGDRGDVEVSHGDGLVSLGCGPGGARAASGCV